MTDLRQAWADDLDTRRNGDQDAADAEHLASVDALIRDDQGDVVDYPTMHRDRCLPGGAFVLDQPLDVPALWGDGDAVLWNAGESLLIVAPTGTGKTTVAVQIVEGRLGLRTDLLGLPIRHDERRLLYLAMDRPQQIARAMARRFHEEHRALLDERLVIWRGPLPADLGKRPETLAELCQREGAGTVIIDSLKDAAVKLTDDEVGGNLNRAIQIATVHGIEVCGLHHQRKGQSGQKPRNLDDVYDSTWITAGAGSVVLLWGSAGDAIVELVHLKQPAGAVGPMKLEHNHLDGTTTVYRGFDLVGFMRNRAPDPVTTMDVARAMLEKEKPTDNERKKAQRLLDGLVAKELATRDQGIKGGAGGSDAALYRLTGDLT